MLERWNAPTHNVYPSFSPSVHCNFPVIIKNKSQCRRCVQSTAMYDGFDADAGTDISTSREIP